MSLKFAALREESTKLQKEAQELIDKVAGDGARQFTDEEKGDNDKRFNRIEQIQSILDEDAKFAKFVVTANPGDKFADGTLKPAATLPTDAPGRDAADATATGPKFSDEEVGRAFTEWASTGTMDRKFATITTATNSGVLLPKTIGTPITPNSANVFREAHDLYGVKPVEGPTTADLTLPVIDANAGGVVAENASTETENTPNVGESIRLPVKTYQSGSVWFSNQQLAANDFDLLATVVPQLTYSKELGLESAIAAAVIADSAITQTVATSTTAAFTYANLVDLNQVLPKRYQRQTIIVLSQAAFSAVQKLVGSDGHPVLVLDPQNQSVSRFNGTPVLRSDYLEAFGVTKCVGIVFSLLGFRLRDVTQQNLQRYVGIPAKPNQTGLDLFAYHGFGYAPSAIAKFMTPAS